MCRLIPRSAERIAQKSRHITYVRSGVLVHWARLEASGKIDGVDTISLALIYMALVTCWVGDFSNLTQVLVETESVSFIVSDRRRFSWWSEYGWIAG